MEESSTWIASFKVGPIPVINGTLWGPYEWPFKSMGNWALLIGLISLHLYLDPGPIGEVSCKTCTQSSDAKCSTAAMQEVPWHERNTDRPKMVVACKTLLEVLY